MKLSMSHRIVSHVAAEIVKAVNSFCLSVDACQQTISVLKICLVLYCINTVSATTTSATTATTNDTLKTRPSFATVGTAPSAASSLTTATG